MYKTSAYFTTKNGRKIILTGAAAFGFILFAGNFFPHTLFLHKYKEVVACYKEGIEVPVPEKVKTYLKTAYEKLGMHPCYQINIQPFTVFGFDIFEGGSTHYRFGCVIGIPTNFCYESEEDVDYQFMRLRNEKIIWDSEDGKFLKKSLVFTEDEKLFAICKSILQLQTHRVLLNSIFPSLSFLSMYAIATSLNQKLNLYAKPLSVRVIMYSILGFFGFGTWAFLKDFNQVLYDISIDKTLAKLEFVLAGISYYGKILKRNIAFENLVGSGKYSSTGNENFLVRQKSLPITYRKAFFESKLQELNKKLNQMAL
ncbi:transmembrane protein 177 isoform X2 [Condylostylus longicornis]|uniref:transmembrane protein 177 isoform X2 n=1 Tax=Condylostylus longicornis TaxID=2530218 RepID=UPI00244E19F4|nr:transmembrane protein 177 isoform X2 [Condylostylus longicornis]